MFQTTNQYICIYIYIYLYLYLYSIIRGLITIKPPLYTKDVSNFAQFHGSTGATATKKAPFSVETSPSANSTALPVDTAIGHMLPFGRKPNH